LRSSPGGRASAGQTARPRHAVRDRRRLAAGRIATATDPKLPEPAPTSDASTPPASPAITSPPPVTPPGFDTPAFTSVVTSAPDAREAASRTRRRRLGWAVTIASALVLIGFIGLAMYSHTGEPRLAAIEQPERALALIVGRTM